MRFNRYGISIPYESRRYFIRDPFSPFGWSVQKRNIQNEYQNVLLIGDANMGKSMLGREVATQLHRDAINRGLDF